MIDLHLIFPPQWSPFQPFLSTPSLKAYLEPRGFQVRQDDWNLEFYLRFLHPRALPRAQQRLERYATTLGDDYRDYRGRVIAAIATLDRHAELYQRTLTLRSPELLGDVASFRSSVQAFRALLDAFSAAEPVIEVGTSSFTSTGVLDSEASLHRFLDDAEDNPFVSLYESLLEGVEQPRTFGVSIIGAEQIVPGLTLCRALRRRFPSTPVVVGGSVFSRLVDKDPAVRGLFGTCFDFLCRYEGERPMADFLTSADPRADRVSNLAFVEDGELVKTPLCEPLGMDEIDTPDFTGLPLERYLTPRLVLPLLTTRGCYWGHCAFCYHGMIYQDRIRLRRPQRVAEDVQVLEQRHGVRHFAFNDEALPPKMFRLLPDVLPPDRYAFTALYKFEKVFTPEQFRRMHRAGFRSLYIGLESASERVLAHMKKGNLQRTMLANLRDAHDAGIWNHAFVFFGFPTETPGEAQETIDFLLDHADIIHSEGTGLFSLEHNAPIHAATSEYGVTRLHEKEGRILEMYYDYEVQSGLDEDAAKATLARFKAARDGRGLYRDATWIPREYLLLLLGHYDRDRLRTLLADLPGEDVQERPAVEVLRPFRLGPRAAGGERNFIVNQVSGRVFEVNDDAVMLMELMGEEVSVTTLMQTFPGLGSMLEAEATG